MSNDNELKRYKTEAQEYHEKATQASDNFLECCRQAGEVLLKVKATVERGKFKKWIAENLSYSYDLAWRYMQVAKNWDKLKKLNTVQFWSLRGALHAIKAASKPASGGNGQSNETKPLPKALRRYEAALRQVLNQHRIKVKPFVILALLKQLGVKEEVITKALKPIQDQIDKKAEVFKSAEEEKTAKQAKIPIT
jgi:hypothetical protein